VKYKQEKFEDSKKLILQAGKWMLSLKSDNFYNAALLLVESKLGARPPISKFEDALESLIDSPYKNTGDYSIIVADLKQIIKEAGT
jgi:hypothetical protein